MRVHKFTYGLFIVVFAFCMALHVDVQAGHERVLKTYEVDNFHSLVFNGSFEVVLEMRNEKKVEIEAAEDVHPYITTEVSGGVLTFGIKKKAKYIKKVKIFVTNPVYRSLEINGAIDVWSKNTIKNKDFEIILAGAGTVDLDVDTQDMLAFLGGAGTLRLSGSATQAEMEIAGAGKIRSYDLVTEDLEVDLSGAGSAHVHATEYLDVEISGIGNVTYEGNPRIKRRVAGLGSLKSR